MNDYQQSFLLNKPVLPPLPRCRVNGYDRCVLTFPPVINIFDHTPIAAVSCESTVLVVTHPIQIPTIFSYRPGQPPPRPLEWLSAATHFAARTLAPIGSMLLIGFPADHWHCGFLHTSRTKS